MGILEASTYDSRLDDGGGFPDPDMTPGGAGRGSAINWLVMLCALLFVANVLWADDSSTFHVWYFGARGGVRFAESGQSYQTIAVKWPDSSRAAPGKNSLSTLERIPA
jgi:hypothetical protein